MSSARVKPVVLIVFPEPTFLSLTEPVPVIVIDSPDTSPTRVISLLTTFVEPSYCLEPLSVIGFAVTSNKPESSA